MNINNYWIEKDRNKRDKILKMKMRCYLRKRKVEKLFNIKN